MIDVLLITFDSPHIDRRILLFARAMKENGYGAKILSPYAEAENGFEDIEIINVFDSPPRATAVSSAGEMLKKYGPLSLFNFAKSAYLKVFPHGGVIPLLREMIEKAVKIKADIYVANDLPALPVGYEAKKKNGGYLVYDAHEFFTGQITIGKEDRAYLNGLESGLIGQADLIITVNRDIADLFERTYPVKQVQVILNATSFEGIPGVSRANLFGINRDKKLVIYQGGFIANRNLSAVVKSAAYLNECAVIMLGWGGLEGELKKEAAGLGILNKKIYFIPRVPQADLLSYTMSAELGLIPYPAVDINTRLCTPNKLFEYVTAGIPIMANRELETVTKFLNRYNIGATADFNKPRQTGQMIESLLSDRKTMQLLRANCDVAKKELSWAVEGAKLKTLLEALLTRPPLKTEQE